MSFQTTFIVRCDELNITRIFYDFLTAHAYFLKLKDKNALIIRQVQGGEA